MTSDAWTNGLVDRDDLWCVDCGHDDADHYGGIEEARPCNECSCPTYRPPPIRQRAGGDGWLGPAGESQI